jgi:hypothetical protein
MKLIDIYIELFKRNMFDFITVVNKVKHKKQEQALKILTSGKYTEFAFGGGAGGAKSWTGCVWLFFMCLAYPGTKYFIGRQELKRIKESTLITFFKVANWYAYTDFKYNAQDSFILFANGSRIDLLELKKKPSDPMFERFGSTEYTSGWIEEGGEVSRRVFIVLSSRVGRHNNEKYNIKGLTFITCNPKRNWIYDTFYDKDRQKKLKPYQKFLQALVKDNPFIAKSYIEQLDRLTDKVLRERLLLGNWDYEDSPYRLCELDSINAVFENDHVTEGVNYITADIARFGSDFARIGVWSGWRLIEVHSLAISKVTEIQNLINTLRVKYKIPKHFCIADEDGVGGGVVDNCGIKGFVNNATPFKEYVGNKGYELPQYQNLQNQCIFGLVEKINKNEIYIEADLSGEDIKLIKDELGSIETDPNSAKLRVLNKEKVKEKIGRSPDFRDMMMMRKYFDYKHTTSFRL